MTSTNLKNFVIKNSDIYIGLSGCLREFDDLVARFIKEPCNKLIAEAEILMENFTEDVSDLKVSN